MEIIPIFKSDFSIGRSVLTLESPKSVKENEPTSIVDIALKNGLKKVYLLENSMSGFVYSFKQLSNHGINIRFGLEMKLCNNINLKNNESLDTESKVCIWIKNDQGYYDLIKIASLAATDGFYYTPRIDCHNIKKMWNENSLKLSIPFYDSFIHKNLLYGSECLPDFSFTKPVFHKEQNDIPFNFLIEEALNNYTKQNKLSIIDTKTIFYNKKKDFIYYLANRCLQERTSLDRPELKHMSSDNFCFEHYLDLKNT